MPLFEHVLIRFEVFGSESKVSFIRFNTYQYLSYAIVYPEIARRKLVDLFSPALRHSS